MFCRKLPLFPYLTRKHSIRMLTTNLPTGVGVGPCMGEEQGLGGCTVRSELNKFEHLCGYLYGKVNALWVMVT